VLTLLVAPYLGMLWEKLVSAPTYINVDGAIYLDNQDTTQFIGDDTWFLVLTLLAGLIAGALGYWRYRRALPAMLGLVAAAIGAAYIVKRVGVAFGPPPIGQAALGLADGHTVHAMIDVKARVVLLAWPVGVALAYVCLIAGLERPVPRVKPAPVGVSVRAGDIGDEVGSRNGRQPTEDAPLSLEKREHGA
jgi:hypothetical protein